MVKEEDDYQEPQSSSTTAATNGQHADEAVATTVNNNTSNDGGISHPLTASIGGGGREGEESTTTTDVVTVDDSDSNIEDHDEEDDEEEEERTLFTNLCRGFAYLRQRRDDRGSISTSGASPAMKEIMPAFLSHVTVNFIDPTSSSITTTTTNSSSSKNVGSTANVYDKFVAIFQRDYACTLTYVPYQLFRNNSSGVIERLPIATVLTKGHGGGCLLEGTSVVGASGGASDERRVCEEPYCHVYLAACESLEHYRTKVKPSIQAFVSQLESAYKSTTLKYSGMVRTGSDIGEPSTPGAKKKRTIAPRYVIVFVPNRRSTDHGNNNNDDSSSALSPKRHTGANRGAVALASRFTAARQRLAAARGSEAAAGMMAVDSAHSINSTTLDSSEADEGSEHGAGGKGGSGGGGSSTVLSKVERELLKRFKHDFPSGNVCTLSTLLTDDTRSATSTAAAAVNGGSSATANNNNNDVDDDNDGSKDEYVQKLEWNAVLKALGAAITAGFQDRCQSYNEELRKLDPRNNNNNNNDDAEGGSNSGGFYINHFFLVKESLAFTYEQMRLPAEALLQYKELRAFLPEMEPSMTDGNSSELARIALAGDCLEFRQSIRSFDDFGPLAAVVEDYLFAREVSLLFQMHKSVRVVLRCLSYAMACFGAQEKEIRDASSSSSLSKEESLQRMVDLQKWAFDFCWNVKLASDYYFKTAVSNKTSVDEYFARGLCDLLEFTRLRLLKLGNLLLPTLQMGSKDLLQSIQCPWTAWTEPSVDALANGDSNTDSVIDTDTKFLEDALSSTDSFLSRYLQLTKVLAECNEFCGRQRYAARLRIERMEIYDRKRESAMAVKELLSVVDIYNQDLWSTCHFALMFRLAAFQREIATPTDYLDTLVRCFNETMSRSAPAKAMDVLHNDLETVVESASVDGASFAAAPLFRPIFGLEGIASPRALGNDRNLLKRLYTIGDTVRVTLGLKSFLPKDVEVDSISIQLVPFRTYVAAMEDHLPIKDSDVFRVLNVEKPVAIQNGFNEYAINWLPKASGQFIMSSATIMWKGVKFTYTAKELRRPTIRIDVVPCEPTQKLDVQPNFLLPGHEQPVTFKFSAGSDVVKKANLQLLGPPGMSLLPPNAEAGSSAWTSSFDAPLPSCPPLETVSLTSKVKVVPADKASPSMQPLLVKVSTSYKNANDEPGTAKTECMETSLTAKIPSLGKPALSVLDSDTVQYSPEKWIINVLLRCNTPVPFTIKSWSIDLPRNMSLSDLGDLNESLAGEQVVTGDRISFSFECSSNVAESATGSPGSFLHVDLTNEDGTNFRESLHLSISRPATQKLKPIERKATAVQLSASATEGLAGVPVILTYRIDTAGLADLPGAVLYKIDFDASEWIVSGKVDGPVGKEVQVIGIPVRTGCIVEFPMLSLLHQNDADSLSLPVKVSSPTHFTGLSPPSHMSVAFPMGASRKSSAKSSV